MASSSIPVDQLPVSPRYRAQEIRKGKVVLVIQPISGATLSAAVAAAQATAEAAIAGPLSAHTTARNNPHGVTAAQVGAYARAEADAAVAAARDAAISTLRGGVAPANDTLAKLAASIAAAVQGVFPAATLAQLNANTTALQGTVDSDGANNGAYVRQTRTDPSTPWVRISTATLAGLDARIATEVQDRSAGDSRRALKSAVAGSPLLAPGVALLARNDDTGQPVAAIMADGEIRGGGKAILGRFSAVLGTPDLRVVYGSGLDGSFTMGPLEHRACLSSLSGFVGEGGGAVAVRTAHGVDHEAATFDAWVGTGGQVYVHAYGSTLQVTADPDRTFLKAEVRGGQFAFVRSDGVRITSPLAGACPVLPSDITALVYGDLYGQSNGAANASGPLIHDQPFNARFWMFGGGQRAFGNWLGHPQERTFLQAPAYDAIHDLALGCEQLVYAAGETSNSGFAAGVLARTDLPQAAVLLTTCSAVGSANMEMLRPDATEASSEINAVGQPWRNLEMRFVRARLRAVALGLSFLAGPLRWNQGEGNLGDLKAAHLAKLVAIRDGWQGLARRWNALWPAAGFGGFAGKAPLITAQTCSGQLYTISGTNYARSQVPWAQLQIGLDDPTTALCLGPTYDQLYAPDGVHLLSAGQEMQGARAAVAWNAWLRGEAWKPLHVRKDAGFAPVRTGTTVRLRIYNHFGLPLVFDTATISGLGPDQGFRWADDGNGNAVTATNAAIVDATTVDLTLSAVPTGTNGAIEVAMTGTPGASSGPASGNRATLRTNGSGTTTDGLFAAARAVEHFICIDRVAVA